MKTIDERDRKAGRPEQVVAARRSSTGVEALVEWLESLAARARRSWLERRARVPLRPAR